ncbi:MAG: transcriptional regulator, partial [Chloroflexota bacterium]|nr:transcriptional regulator [Chloroflexota bacterium]
STYPVAAIQQITRNAVMHRSYEGNNAPVRVYWYDDRIEIISSGGVFGSVTAENFGQPGVTAYRNPNLAEAMRNLGFVQRFGLGIPLAKRLLREAGHPEIGSKVDSHNVLMTIHACTEED